MRYFVVVLFVFAFLHLPGLEPSRWLASPPHAAILALAVGVFLSGIHHAVFAGHYVELLPARLPARSAQVYLSATLRMLFGLGLCWAPLRTPAAIGTLILLCLVLPVNLRVARQGNPSGQLLTAGWFLWLRLAVHLAWIGWCIWCLVLALRA